MGELVRKRGRPIKVGSKRRRIEIRMSESEYSMLVELSRITGKNFTDILVDGLSDQYDKYSDSGYDFYDDYYFDEGFDE